MFLLGFLCNLFWKPLGGYNLSTPAPLSRARRILFDIRMAQPR
jgi:hypothetical protein